MLPSIPFFSSLHPLLLADPSYEALSDCFAVVEGACLPLHRQMLAARAAVLRELFVSQGEAVGGGGGGGASPGPQEPVELSSAFAGCSLLEVAVFLRLVYAPDQATPGSLRAVHQ